MELEEVVYWMSKILFTAEIVLCGLHRSMAQQELNLFQFTTAIMAQLRACSPQIMRSNVLQSRFLAAGSDHVPDNILRNAIAHTFPNLATARKILPSLTSAARVHWSRAALTHAGIGTVRMWPPLPIISTTAQWP
jgi:hypothetical protein